MQQHLIVKVNICDPSTQSYSKCAPSYIERGCYLSWRRSSHRSTASCWADSSMTCSTHAADPSIGSLNADNNKEVVPKCLASSDGDSKSSRWRKTHGRRGWTGSACVQAEALVVCYSCEANDYERPSLISLDPVINQLLGTGQRPCYRLLTWCVMQRALHMEIL